MTTAAHWTPETRDVLSIIKALAEADLRSAKVEVPVGKGIIKIEVRK